MNKEIIIAFFIRTILPTIVKSAIVTVFFAVVHLFYNFEIIRSNIEDLGFDITNKYLLEQKSETLNAPKVLLFAFDDNYMKSAGLFNDKHQTNYGYSFPRDKIADFIKNLDSFVSKIEKQNLPKALFIDYDMTYTSMPYGKSLSKEDEILVETLKQNRPYIILLPKIENYNFIEQSNDSILQQKIQEGKIKFVSVSFLSSSDQSTRRYSAYESYLDEHNQTKKYINVNVALWNLLTKNVNDKQNISNFKEKDIIANRILLKTYKEKINENNTQILKSNWENYKSYSANYSLYHIVEEDFTNSIIMLGGTYTTNSDLFDILNVGGTKSIKGIELHANTLMSIFYFDGQLKLLSFFPSLLIVFFVFFFVDILTKILFDDELFYETKTHKLFKLVINSKTGTHSKLYFAIVLTLTTSILLLISYYLLTNYAIWFNWFVPFAIYQLMNVYHLWVKKSKTLKESYEIIFS